MQVVRRQLSGEMVRAGIVIGKRGRVESLEGGEMGFSCLESQTHCACLLRWDVSGVVTRW